MIRNREEKKQAARVKFHRYSSFTIHCQQQQQGSFCFGQEIKPYLLCLCHCMLPTLCTVENCAYVSLYAPWRIQTGEQKLAVPCHSWKKNWVVTPAPPKHSAFKGDWLLRFWESSQLFSILICKPLFNQNLFISWQWSWIYLHHSSKNLQSQNCSSFFHINIHKNVRKHFSFLRVDYKGQENNVAAAGM